MIRVRFFTGVTVEYVEADGINARPEKGYIEIRKGPEDGDVLALVQNTAGAIIESSGGVVIMPVMKTINQQTKGFVL